MNDHHVTFDTPNLAERVAALSPEELDALPFGVIALDASDGVRLYNATEARLSGRRYAPAPGSNFFVDIAPCMNNDLFKGRIEKARAAGRLNIRFSFVGDFADRDRELTVRIQSTPDGGIWIFHQRPG